MAFIGKDSAKKTCDICHLARYKFKRTKKRKVGNVIVQNEIEFDKTKPHRELYYYSLVLRIVSDIHMGKLPSMLCNPSLTNMLKDCYVSDITESDTALEAMDDMVARAQQLEARYVFFFFFTIF